jgi:hypothetical protein
MGSSLYFDICRNKNGCQGLRKAGKVLINAVVSTGRCNPIGYESAFKGGDDGRRERLGVYSVIRKVPGSAGSNENTNGLVRQYFPKRTDLSGYTQADLDKVALRLNPRPRKNWDFKRLRLNYKKVLRRSFEPAALARR